MKWGTLKKIDVGYTGSVLHTLDHLILTNINPPLISAPGYFPFGNI